MKTSVRRSMNSRFQIMSSQIAASERHGVDIEMFSRSSLKVLTPQ